MALGFPVFSNWAIFSVDLLHEYLTFKVSYAKFSVMLPINEHSSHYYEQFGGCSIKIKQILSILQGFKQGIGFPSVFQVFGDFFPGFSP